MLPQTTYSNRDGIELRWGVLQHMSGLLDASKGLKEAYRRAQHTLLLHKVVPAAALHEKRFQHQREGLDGPAKSTVPMQPS